VNVLLAGGALTETGIPKFPNVMSAFVPVPCRNSRTGDDLAFPAANDLTKK
jgi:hypothetical protein